MRRTSDPIYDLTEGNESYDKGNIKYCRDLLKSGDRRSSVIRVFEPRNSVLI